MSDRPTLSQLAEAMECRRISNLAWIRQAEEHNPKSANLPGARELSPVYAEAGRWLDKLAELSDAVGGDDARVEEWLNRALTKAHEGSRAPEGAAA